MLTCYYFGCQEQAGHYWWDRSGPRHGISDLVGPNIWPKIDGGFCPGVVIDERGREKKTRPEVEGEAALHYVNGWTILAFWDRSVDKRGACNSNFVVKGTHTFEEVMQAARESFPQVLDRLKFEIKLVTR